MVVRAASATFSLAEERSPSIWETTSSSSRGESQRANWPRYSGMYLEISLWPDSRALESSTAISLRRSRLREGAMARRDSPAMRRTTTFSLTLMRLEKWVAMWRRFWPSVRSA